MNELILYHGSKNIIEKPIYHGGKKENDYGYGFYCTESLELAKEWACSNNSSNGFANKYSLIIDNLKILDLTEKKYSILNWIAILLRNRTFDLTNEISIQAKDYIIQNFYIDICNYDIVIGYRADDSYFSFAKDFINNTISVRQLSKAMSLGNLGKQVVLISEKAFNNIKFEDFENVNHLKYYPKRQARDEKARKDYLEGQLRTKSYINDIFVIDIMRRGIKNGDPNLQ